MRRSSNGVSATYSDQDVNSPRRQGFSTEEQSRRFRPALVPSMRPSSMGAEPSGGAEPWPRIIGAT